jgi:hypothetical protein
MTTSITAPAGTWAPAGDLPTAAAWYGQHDGPVVLDGGAVLVAGGADAANASIPNAATFDPATGSWSPAGNLATPRRLHTLIRLPNGKVLAAGGLNGNTGQRSAELYDPEKREWKPTGDMGTARWGHSAALLRDGTVLVSGGNAIRSGGGTTALRSAERFDPEQGEWHTAAAMTDARTAHTALPLAGGVILVVGGVAPVGAVDDPALAFCELYDPAHDRWTPTGSLLRGRRHHRAIKLTDNTVLVTGGTAPGSPGAAPYDPFSQRTVELFDLATGTWSGRNPMPSGRAFHRAIPLPDDGVLVVGGAASDRDEAGYRSALGYDVAGNEWASAAGLDNGRWSFAAVALDDGKVLVTGGAIRSGLAAADPATTELTRATEVFGEHT